MKTLIPILFLLCAGWLEAEEPAAATPKTEAYRTTEFETWEELEKQIVPVTELEQATFEDVIRICRSAQTKSPEEGGIVFADAPPELAGRKIDFEWSKLGTTEIEVSGLIGRAVENRRATLVQEGKKVLFKPIDYAVTESDTPLAPKEIETKRILERRIIPRVDFQSTTLSEAMDFLRMRNAEIHFAEAPKEPSILVSGRELRTARIKKLNLRNVTLWNLLHILAEETKTEVGIADDIVVIYPRGGKGPDFSVKEGTFEARIKERLDKRILPRVDFEEVTLVDALDFMRMRDAELFSEAVGQSE